MDRSLEGVRIGIALTGSFCTFKKVFALLPILIDEGAQLFPIMSDNAYNLDTRFYTAQEARETLARICGRPCWHEIPEVEPIGPQKLLDLLLVAPCTGNTMAKLAHGIVDTTVTMAAKSMMRNERPVVLAVSTNDGLSGNAANIGALQSRRYVYFVPYCQDDHEAKPTSLVFDERAVPGAVHAALEGRQMQPMLRVLTVD